MRLLRSGDSARPRIIWHAPGERIELSGRVLSTWVAKAADLLQEDLDAEVGTRVRLEGAPHWRLLVWALATWTVGGTVQTRDGSERVDVLVADGERLASGEVDAEAAEVVVGLTRAALARRSPVDLPDGVIDEAATLLSYADEMEPYDRASDDDIALVADSPAGEIAYANLVGAGTADRIHVSGSVSLTEVLLAATSAWAGGGSVVLTDPAWEADHGGDPTSGAFADVLESEGVSAPRA